jgi:hypothetical protein
VDAAGRISDLPIIDARGDGVVLAGRTVDHGLGKGEDLARGRYLPLAREAVEQADEIWLAPGATPDGRISLRRYYLKIYEGADLPDAVLAIAEFQRGVWEEFNVLPLRAAEANKRRVGLLLHARGGLP